jgi:imidazoleglycerol-phosphate dehydratase/histidinol-phosphatase
MQKILFIDRDGTLIEEPPTDYQIDALEKFTLVPGVISALKQIVTKTNYSLVMVSNQDGLGTASFPEETFTPYQNLLIDILSGEGITFDAIHIDPSLPEENSPNRKPEIGMLKGYFNGKYNIAESYVIGDRFSDVQLADNLGAKAIFFNNKSQESTEAIKLQTTNWQEIVDFLTTESRQATIQRKTKETDISIFLNLNRFENPKIETGVGFFNHMLEQIGFHGNVQLEINCKGDLEVDEHHTIEDTALALGEAFAQALENKKGLTRYGFTLPMDESLATVAIDFGGRPYLKWDVEFIRNTVGEIDVTLFEHFFRSFAQNAACTLHIEARGENDHHIIEGVFKAFARAVRMAIAKSDDGVLPSSKGNI